MKKLFLLCLLLASCEYRGSNGVNGKDGSTGPKGEPTVYSTTIYASILCTGLVNGFYGRSVSKAYLIYDSVSNTNANKCMGHSYRMSSKNSTLVLGPKDIALFVPPNSVSVLEFN